MSLESIPLPAPPKFLGSDIKIPQFFQCSHPYTKWMLNMIRCGATFRIITMIKERPELFQQIYQIPDCPDLVRHESHDTISMFNRHTVLFLNPLCLAIYMKKEKSVELILKSGLISSNQKCWASEVFSRSQSSRGDLLEIFPICIAIRREYFEVIPILVHCEPKNSDVLLNFKKLDVTEKIEIHYENGEGRKIYRYKDSLQYAIDTLKLRGNLPLSRLLELFMIDCPNLFNPYKLEEDKNGNMFSLFFRLAKVAYFDDPDCRICMQLIQCLEVLLKHRCVPWNGLTSDLKTVQYTFNGSLDNNEEKNVIIKDHCLCIGYLLALYNQIQKKVKNGPLDNLGYLIIKALQQTQWIDEFIKMSPEHLQNKFGKITPDITVPLETASFVKRHVQAIMELEKEREFKSNIFSKSKNISYRKRYHRRSCSLVEQYEPGGAQNLLQSRITNSNIIVSEFTNIQSLSKPLKTHNEPLKSDELVPLFVYQTGVNNCETQTLPESLLKNKKFQTAKEVVQSPAHSEKCEKLEVMKHSLIPELYKKQNTPQEQKHSNFECPPFTESDISESNNMSFGTDMYKIKAQKKIKPLEQLDKIHNLKNNFIPGLCKRDYNNQKESNDKFDIQHIDFGDFSETNSVINCLEMTPIKSCQTIKDIYCFSPKNHIVNPSGDIQTKQIYMNTDNSFNYTMKYGDKVLNANNSKISPIKRINFFDELEVIDDLVMLNNAEESDFSMELSDNDRLIEFEDDLLDELFIEYNELREKCINDPIIYPRNKLKTISEVPFISKRNNSKYVNIL